MDSRAGTIAAQMFFFLPIGHDRSFFGYPLATAGIIILCTGIFLTSAVFEQSAMVEVQRAMHRVETVRAKHPEARVDWTVEGLPEEFTVTVFDPLYDPDLERYDRADEDLDEAMQALVGALNGVPNLRYGYRPGAGSFGTLVSSMFMHGGFGHLFGNMVFLFLAGTVIESFWRRGPFLALFFAAGVTGTLMHHAFNVGSMVPLVGASGAIAGLLGAFVVGHPSTGIRIGYIVWTGLKLYHGTWVVPAWVCIPAWAALQIGAALLGAQDGVAYWAHVGGFGVGVASALMMKQMDWTEDHGEGLEVDYGLETGAADQERDPEPLELLPLIELDEPSED